MLQNLIAEQGFRISINTVGKQEEPVNDVLERHTEMMRLMIQRIEMKIGTVSDQVKHVSSKVEQLEARVTGQGGAV